MGVLTRTDKPPSKKQLHLLADYVELRCASSESRAFSAEEFQDARKRADQDDVDAEEVTARELFFEEEAIDAAVAAALDLIEPETEPALEVVPPDPDAPNTEAGEAAADDVRELEAADVITHLQYRVETFGDWYPFALRNDAVLELRTELTSRQWLYLALLAASNLRHIRRKSDQAKLSTYFELIAPTVIQAHLGPRARVELFGTSTPSTGTRYSGSLWEKLQLLKDDLRLPLLARNTDAEVADENVGDHGLDVVAWFPFGDRESNLVTLFAQCACGRQWSSKMDEPTEGKWNRIFTFHSPVVNALLIPYCFRSPDGGWYSTIKVHKGVLFDRARILTELPTDVELPIAADAWPSDLLSAITEPGDALVAA